MMPFESKHLQRYLPSDITNYDVLLRKHPNDHIEIVSFQDHIGNRRFQIIIENHRKAYNIALQQHNRDRCEIIIKNIAHTICHTCVPRGRFLEFTKNDSEAHWEDLGQGHLAWDRVHRGLAGLLYFLPIETYKSQPLHLHLPPPATKKRKRIHVDLADERFKIKEQKLSSQLDQTTDIRTDDVLFYGEEKNAIIIFSNHTGNNRLKHMIGLKIKSHTIKTLEDIFYFSLQVALDLVKAYPKTRYLQQQGNHWVAIDVKTATKMLQSAMCRAWNFYSKDNKSTHELSNETKTSWDESIGKPMISDHNSSIQVSRNSSPVGSRAA